MEVHAVLLSVQTRVLVGRVLIMRGSCLLGQESEDLEKMELDLVVLSALHSTRTSDSTCHEVLRASINYHFEGTCIKICKAAFLFVYAIGARRLKNL